MSGPGGKPKVQTTLSQKGKLMTVHRTTAESEAQDRGRTRATGTVDIDEENQEINDSEKGRALFEEKLLLVPEGAPLTLSHSLSDIGHARSGAPGNQCSPGYGIPGERG